MEQPLTAHCLTYRRLTHALCIEVSDWSGDRTPSLSPHLHDEAQATAVFSGCRYFRVGSETLVIPAGSFAIIPAGVPHMSVGVCEEGTRSRDIFLSQAFTASVGCSQIMFGSLPRVPEDEQDIIFDTLLEAFRSEDLFRQSVQLGTTLPDEIIQAVRESAEPIATIAGETGLTREGFIRKFARDVGMTPLAYRIACRASRARAALRADQTPVMAAYDAGFADQSHLGRVFRKNFGTTPAAFARIWRS